MEMLIHSFTHSFIDSFIHLFIHFFTRGMLHVVLGCNVTCSKTKVEPKLTLQYIRLITGKTDKALGLLGAQHQNGLPLNQVHCKHSILKNIV